MKPPSPRKPAPPTQVEVQIMGQSYLLACPPGGHEALLEAVERVDTAMCRIRDAGKVRARDRIAVLASLNLAYELSQARTELEALQSAARAPAPPAPAAPSPTEAAAHARLTALAADIDRRLAGPVGLPAAP